MRARERDHLETERWEREGRKREESDDKVDNEEYKKKKGDEERISGRK